MGCQASQDNPPGWKPDLALVFGGLKSQTLPLNKEFSSGERAGCEGEHPVYSGGTVTHMGLGEEEAEGA